MIPADWDIMSIGNSLIEIYRYPTYFNIKYVESGVPEIRGELIKEGGTIEEDDKAYRYISKETANRFPRVHLEPNDFVMSVRGTMGKIAIVPERLRGAVITANLIRMKFLKSLIEPKWIHHYLTSEFFQEALDLATSATTIKTIQVPQLCAINFIRPPINEQRRIAKILDTIDEAIQKAEALISKLKAMKQGLLHDLLTRGLGQNGKLRDPKTHPEQFKDSPLGRIPRGWDVCELNDVAVKIQDGTHFSPKTTQGPFRYLTSKNIRFGEVDLSECGWISKKEHESIYSRCDVKYGDVLLTKDGANTGNAAINRLNEPVSLLSSIAFIRCGNEQLHSDYVLHYLLSPNSQQRIKDLMSGNAITRLTLTIIKSFKISVPDYKEQCRIIEPLNLYNTRIRAEEKYRDKLKLQKKGLMHDLLTGKVRVKV